MYDTCGMHYDLSTGLGVVIVWISLKGSVHTYMKSIEHGFNIWGMIHDFEYLEQWFQILL